MRAAIDASLRRLGTDHVDLYQLHRVDPRRADRGDVGRAWPRSSPPARRGAIGMSEATVDELERAHAVHPVATRAERAVAVDARRARRGAAVVRRARRRVHPVRPARPRLPDRPAAPTRRSTPTTSARTTRASRPRRMEANRAIVDARPRGRRAPGATPAQVALAWVLAQGEQVVPIPGTKRIAVPGGERGAAARLALSADDLAELDALPHPVGHAVLIRRTTSRPGATSSRLVVLGRPEHSVLVGVAERQVVVLRGHRGPRVGVSLSPPSAPTSSRSSVSWLMVTMATRGGGLDEPSPRRVLLAGAPPAVAPRVNRRAPTRCARRSPPPRPSRRRRPPRRAPRPPPRSRRRAGRDRDAGRVGLQREQQRVVRQAAVDAQNVDLHRLAHRVEDVGDAPRDRVERRPRDVRGTRRRRSARPRPRGARVPPAAHRARSARAAPARRPRRRRSPPARRARAGRRQPEVAESHSSSAPRRRRRRRAPVRAPADPPGDRRQQPIDGLAAGLAGMGEHEHAGAVRRLHAARRDTARPGQRRPAGRDPRAQRAAARASGVAQARRGRRAVSRPSAAARRARRSARRSHGSQPRQAELRTRRGRRVGGEPGPEALAHERVDVAEAQRAALAGLRHRGVVLEEPGELARGEVRVERQARASRGSPPSSRRASTDSERLSCQTTTGVSGAPVSASHASTDSPSWSRPHAITSPGARASTSATASTIASSTASGSFSTHPGRGWVTGTPPARLGQRPQVEVVEHGLDGGRALVDAEQAAGHPARKAAVRRHHGPSPGSGGASSRGSGAAADTPGRDHPGDVLADAERRAQAGRADRGDVDDLRARRERLDDVVHVAAGGAQAGVGRRPARDRRAAGASAPPGRAPRRAAVARTDQSSLSVPIDGRRSGHDLAVERREDEHALRPRRRHGQQDAVDVASKTKNSPLRG